MNDIVQYSIVLPNKPGELARIMGRIAESKINLAAITVVDTHEHGVVRIVPEADAVDALRGVLQSLNVPLTETRVLTVELSNRPGALAKVMHQLAVEKINILYAYATSGAPGGRTTGVLKVNNLTKAIKVLEGGKAGSKDLKSPRRKRGR